jgi:hypothetical protein
MEPFKKGGKVKKKKAMKQKQKQNVKQSVVVKINNGGGRRRAYAPRVHKPYVNVYTPPIQDQNAYQALREQLKELQKVNNKEVVKAQAPQVVEGTQPIQDVRERQQREYQEAVRNPEVPVPESEVLRPRVRAKTQPIDSNSYVAQLIKEYNSKPVKAEGPPPTPVSKYVQDMGKASAETPPVTVAHRARNAPRGGGARAQPTDTEDEPVKRPVGRPRKYPLIPQGEGLPPAQKAYKEPVAPRRSRRNRKLKVSDAPVKEYN